MTAVTHEMAWPWHFDRIAKRRYPSYRRTYQQLREALDEFRCDETEEAEDALKEAFAFAPHGSRVETYVARALEQSEWEGEPQRAVKYIQAALEEHRAAMAQDREAMS